MKSYLCEDAESVMELSFSCGSYVWNCARHLKHSLVANVVRWDWSMFSYYNPPLLERHCTLGCWELSPCGSSRLLCGRCSTSTFHNRTWIYLLWVIFNNFDFFLTMQISCPRIDRWNIFGRQEVESLQARLENRRLSTCNVLWAKLRSCAKSQVRQESIFLRINEKREWLTSFDMVCNQTTYMWQSRQSTRCCDGRWTWSTWRTSRQPPPSPPRRRNGTPHWSSPGWKWDFDQEVKENKSSFEL